MSANLHRQVDWRKLNLDHSVRPRRCHDRSIYGRLQPMNREDKTAPYCVGLAVAVVAYFTWRML